MYNFIITKSFLDNQNEYISRLTEKEYQKFINTKAKFQKNIFDKSINTHDIYQANSIKVYSSYINEKDRIIFFYKKPEKIFLYKIMTDHNYKKLLSNIDFALKDFLNNF